MAGKKTTKKDKPNNKLKITTLKGKVIFRDLVDNMKAHYEAKGYKVEEINDVK